MPSKTGICNRSHVTEVKKVDRCKVVRMCDQKMLSGLKNIEKLTPDAPLVTFLLLLIMRTSCACSSK